MRNETFDRAIDQLLQRDARYPRAAYELMPEVLDYTFRERQRHERTENLHTSARHPQHVSGQQLAEGFRDYLLNLYGPFAADVVEKLRIRSTMDIGNLVYNLISVGCFGKTKEDQIEDFLDVYDFKEAFVRPYDVQNPEYWSTQKNNENGLA